MKRAVNIRVGKRATERCECEMTDWQHRSRAPVRFFFRCMRIESALHTLDLDEGSAPSEEAVAERDHGCPDDARDVAPVAQAENVLLCMH